MPAGSGQVTLVKVFISSPEDAEDLRDLAEDILNQEISTTTVDRLGLVLRAERWENWVPTVADGGLNSVYLPREEECQIFACILRRQYGEGTDREVNLALERHQSGEVKKLYVFCERTDDPEPALEDFKTRLTQDGRVFWKSFVGRLGFTRAFMQAMYDYVIEVATEPTAASSAGATL